MMADPYYGGCCRCDAGDFKWVVDAWQQLCRQFIYKVVCKTSEPFKINKINKMLADSDR